MSGLAPDARDLFDALALGDRLPPGVLDVREVGIHLPVELFDVHEIDASLPGGTFTSEQVRNWTVIGFQHVCELEGVKVPDAAVILAAIDARWPGWPGEWTEPRRIGPRLPATEG